jgi:hypothetical protein
MATGSFGDSGDPFREEHFTRKACAELLLDAGAVVAPSVCHSLINSRAKGLIDLFHRRGLFPRTLKFLAALGDVNGVRSCLDTNADDLAAVNEAFMYACHLQHATAAALLLDRAITIDAELGRRIEGGPGRSAFVQYFIVNRTEVRNPDPAEGRMAGPWQAFVKQQVARGLDDGDLTSFVEGLRRESWLLSDACVKFQVFLIEGTAAALNDRAAFLKAILGLDPAVHWVEWGNQREQFPAIVVEIIKNWNDRAWLEKLLVRIGYTPELHQAETPRGIFARMHNRRRRGATQGVLRVAGSAW